MRILLQDSDGDKNSTICPPLTTHKYIDDQESCVYTSLAYGIVAAVALIILSLPFLLIYCCILRKRNKRQSKRFISSSSQDSGSVRDYPYQVTLSRNHAFILYPILSPLLILFSSLPFPPEKSESIVSQEWSYLSPPPLPSPEHLSHDYSNSACHLGIHLTAPQSTLYKYPFLL